MEIPFAKADFGIEERHAVENVLEGTWLASGPEVEAFEKAFAEHVGADFAVTCNSGSSANLLALASLGLEEGSKVITSACGFPATLSPILHLGLKPVLVDYDLHTHNIDIEQAVSMFDNASAVIFAHTLGNPVDNRLINAAHLKGVAVIEDCCEAVGSKIHGTSVGTFGTLGTYSFYPAHQITAEGTGGMVVTSDESMARRLRSLRDWGKVWDWDTKLGDVKTKYNATVDGVPYHKGYAYESVGWNFKLSETASAFGRVQLGRLDGFAKKRLENYKYLYKNLLTDLIDDERFMFVKPLPTSEPAWFGFPITLMQGDRQAFGDYLEANGIRHRPFFAGNITRHEPFRKYAGYFPIADKLMADSLFIGIGQWLGKEQLDYIAEVIKAWKG